MRRFTSFAIAIAIAITLTPAVQAAQSERPSAQQMSELAGDYQLSDGRRLSIDFDGYDVYVQLDKKPRQQLQGTADGDFTTIDGAISIRHKTALDRPALDVRLRGQAVTIVR